MPTDPKQAHIALELPADAPLMACRFDPAGRFVFATGEDRKIYRWELAGGKRVTFAGHESWIGDLVLTADGQTLISAGWDDTLSWWSAGGEEASAPTNKVKAHDGWIRSLALSADGKLLASGGNDRVLRLWNIDDGAKVREISGPARDIYSVLFHPSGTWVLAGDLDGKIWQWNVATGALVRTFDAAALHTYEGGQQVHYGGVRTLAFSPDAKWLLAGGLHKGTNPLGNVQEPLALRFEWDSAKLIRNHLTDGNPNERIWSLIYHPEAFLIGCIGGGKGQLVFWNAADEKPFHVFGLPGTARCAAMHPDNLRIATTHFDNKLRVVSLTAKA